MRTKKVVKLEAQVEKLQIDLDIAQRLTNMHSSNETFKAYVVAILLSILLMGSLLYGVRESQINKELTKKLELCTHDISE